LNCELKNYEIGKENFERDLNRQIVGKMESYKE